MIIETLVVGMLQTNCYLIGDDQAGEGAIIDPGGDSARILDALAHLPSSLNVRYVINTHAHFDHMVGNHEVLQALSHGQEIGPELVVHPQAASLLAASGGARWFGFSPVPSPEPDRFVSDGDELPLGQLNLQILHTPGHSPGSISLYCATQGVVFVGDVLFRLGVGRYDLPGGNWTVLRNSIHDRLFALADDTVVYPGHGASTTIGAEKRDNLFIR
jgi:glyoxylase-like metal-dependent hydrolase (beta-lactamase superfamily II)